MTAPRTSSSSPSKRKARTIYLQPVVRAALQEKMTLRQMLGLDTHTHQPATTSIRLTDEEVAFLTDGGKQDFQSRCNYLIYQALKG